jgi:hypothetical protein
MMNEIQKLVDVPTWRAEYEHAIEDGDVESMAIAKADQAVIDAQGSREIKDKSALLEGTAYKRIFTMFMGYWNRNFNLSRNALIRTRYNDPASVARLGLSFLLLHAIPTALTFTALSYLRPNKKRKNTAGQFSLDLLSSMMSTMPLVREVAQGLQGHGGSGPAGLRNLVTLTDLVSQLRQAKADVGLARAVVGGVGAFSGLPTVQASRTIEELMRELNGAPVDPRALLFGPAR